MTHPYQTAGTRGIYAIKDPTNGLIKYVGRSNNIEARYVAHRAGVPTTGRQFDRSKWRQHLRSLGLEPELVILEKVPEGVDLAPIERKWLTFYQAKGEADFNYSRVIGNVSPLTRANMIIDDLKAENARLRVLLTELDPLLQ